MCVSELPIYSLSFPIHANGITVSSFSQLVSCQILLILHQLYFHYHHASSDLIPLPTACKFIFLTSILSANDMSYLYCFQVS
jgi:hypothetical protein